MLSMASWIAQRRAVASAKTASLRADMDGVVGMRRGTLGLMALSVAVLASVGGALASTGHFAYKDCIANKGENGCTEPARNSLRGAADVAVSPDDRSVYATSILGNGVSQFKRRANGALRYAGCIASEPAHGCTRLHQYMMWGAAGVDVSPDGRSLYVASFIGGTLTRFDRAPNGALTYRGCFQNGGRYACKEPRHRSLADARDVAVSPDGKSVYVTGGFSSSITSFRRSADGALSDGGCFANRGRHGCRKPIHNSLHFTAEVAVSPDGRSVYVTSASALTRFKRDDRGALTYAGCYADRGAHGCRKLRHGSVRSAGGIAVSPDGGSVYVAGTHDNVINRFNRKANGALHYKGCFSNRGIDGCRKPRHVSFREPGEIAVSSDGRSVYVSGVRADSLTRFRRSANGALEYAGCFANGGEHGCHRPRHDSIGGPEGVAVSSDNDSVYVASFLSDSISRFNSP
jgi:DNA-binding beta-propeller fold protein YncE